MQKWSPEPLIFPLQLCRVVQLFALLWKRSPVLNLLLMQGALLLLPCPKHEVCQKWIARHGAVEIQCKAL